MSVEVQSVPGIVAKELSGLSVDLPVIARVGIKDGEVIALGGLAYGADRCWLWFHVNGEPKNIVRQALQQCETMKRVARQFGATEVYTPRDPAYPSSERLCRLAGFEKTDEISEGQEIWRAMLHKDNA